MNGEEPNVLAVISAGVPAQIELDGAMVGFATGNELDVIVIGQDVELTPPVVATTL